MFYGLRVSCLPGSLQAALLTHPALQAPTRRPPALQVHPEFYPLAKPCSSWEWAQVPAVFDGLVTYRNGVKGAIFTQVRPAPLQRCSGCCLRMAEVLS
jgi:hypothetical protein